MQVTSLYAGILALLYAKITMDTVRARWKHQVSLGSGKNEEIAGIVGAHSNFAAYSVFLLFLVFLLENTGHVHPFLLHFLATIFTLGRWLHYRGMSAEKMNFKQRKRGMQLTILPLVLLAVLNIYSFFAPLF